MKKKQEGMALIVSLSLMTMALILGVSSMQTASVDEAAAGSNRAAANALMAAEFGASAQLDSISSSSPSDFSVCPTPVVFGNETSVSNSQDQTASYAYAICTPSSGSEIVKVLVKGVAGDISRGMQVEMSVKSVESTFTTLAALNFAALCLHISIFFFLRNFKLVRIVCL
jgi:Tfp pilus assembly protein PilX